MSKKNKIIEALNNGKRNIDIAKKYDVEPSYVSHIIKELGIKKRLETLDKILEIIKKKGVKAYKEQLTEEEQEFWRTL